MAQWLANDEIDYAAYEKQTEFKAKVKPASEFSRELEEHFRPPPGQPKSPDMPSTKLRGRLQFRKGEVTAWAGYNKHRKSMFTGQVALDLCMQKQKTLIISLEMYPQETLARIARQAAGSNEPSAGWLDIFNSWTNGRLWMFDHVGEISPASCLGVCRYFAQELGGQHVFIDSMMRVVATEEKFDEQKQFVSRLLQLAQDTGLHIHLIAHCRKPDHGDEGRPPTKYDIKGTGSISDLAHNIVMVWANKLKERKLEINPQDIEAQGQPDAMVLVEGQRNGAYEGRLQLWFDSSSMRFCDDRFSQVQPHRLLP